MHMHTLYTHTYTQNTCKLLIDAEEESDTQFPPSVACESVPLGGASLQQLICGQNIVGALSAIGKPECKLMCDCYIIVYKE